MYQQFMKNKIEREQKFQKHLLIIDKSSVSMQQAKVGAFSCYLPLIIVLYRRLYSLAHFVKIYQQYT